MQDIKNFLDEKLKSTESDYDKLDQGEFSTNVRHEKAAAHIAQHNHKSILDIGCGTGLILDRIDAVELYHGIDIYSERLIELSKRVAAKNPGEFKFNLARTENFDSFLNDVDGATATYVYDYAIVMGPIGYSTISQEDDLQNLVEFLMEIASAGCITIPTKTDEWSGHDWLIGFDRKFVENIAPGISVETTKQNGQEVILTWNH